MGQTASQIDFGTFRSMLLDPGVPDRSIAPYLTGDPARSRAFGPHIVADPARVKQPPGLNPAMRTTSALAGLNDIAAWRRQEHFRLAPPNDPRPVIVAEGDSWLQFPFLLDDVVDQLAPQWRVWCVSAAGDTLANMIYGAPEYLTALRAPGTENARAFLFSGTGNDFIGDENGLSVIPSLLRPYTAGKSAQWYIDTPRFRERKAFVREALDQLLTEVALHVPGRRVVLVGYDYVRPFEGEGDPRPRVVYARRDQWLTGPMTRQLGIMDPLTRRQIAAAMIDELHAILAELCGGNTATGKHRHGYHADTRNTLPSLTDWNDEIHPTDDGFARIAARIARWL